MILLLKKLLNPILVVNVMLLFWLLLPHLLFCQLLLQVLDSFTCLLQLFFVLVQSIHQFCLLAPSHFTISIVLLLKLLLKTLNLINRLVVSF